MDFDIKNPDLAPGGRHRIDWAEQEMTVLRGLREQFGQGTAVCRGAHRRNDACNHRNSQFDDYLTAGWSRCGLVGQQPA